MMLSDRVAHLQGAAARLRIKGESALHLKPDGGTEWLWGVFRAPRKEPDVVGLEIELQDLSPRLRMLAADATYVCKYRETSFQGNDAGSRLVIRGQEYGVRDMHLTDHGEAILELSSDCSPSPHAMNPPNCIEAVRAANSCDYSEASEPEPETQHVETPANPRSGNYCPAGRQHTGH